MRRLFSFIIAIAVSFLMYSPAHSKPEVRHISLEILQKKLSQPETNGIQNGLERYMASKAGGTVPTAWRCGGSFALTSGVMNEEVRMEAHSDTTKTKEKGKRKEEPEAEKKRVRKEESESQTDEISYDEDDDSSDDCFTECLGGLLVSFCDNLFSDSDDVAVQGAAEGDQVTGSEDEIESPFTVPCRALIDPANPYADGVSVWDRPGGHEAHAEIVISLPSGTEVTVTESSAHGDTYWAKIETVGTPATVGWVQERELMVSLDAMESAEEPVGEEEPFYDFSRLRWQLLVDMSAPILGDEELNEEYGGNLFRIGAESRLYFVHSLHLDFFFSYARSEGDPQFDYVIGAITESPSASTLQIWSFGVRFGQLYQIRKSSWFVLWGAGPAVFNLEESADITIIENGVVTGERTDELSRWKVGGEFRFEAGRMIGERVPVSANMMLSVLPWNSEQQKSLSFDFTERNVIDFFSIGISVGFTFF
jgi:hypothetical protein